MSNADFERIKTSLQVLCGTFGKRLDSQTLLFWCTELERHAGERLWAAFSSAVKSDGMPTLRWLIDHAADPIAQGWKAPPPQTPQQKRKSDHAAIMSMLWLKNNHGHTGLGALILQRLFPGDRNKALETAEQVYTPEIINKWMEDQNT